MNYQFLSVGWSLCKKSSKALILGRGENSLMWDSTDVPTQGCTGCFCFIPRFFGWLWILPQRVQELLACAQVSALVPLLQWSLIRARDNLPLAWSLCALFLHGTGVLLGVMACALAALPWCHPASKRFVPVVTSCLLCLILASRSVAFKNFVLHLSAGEAEAWCEEVACPKAIGAVCLEQQPSAFCGSTTAADKVLQA